LRPQLITSCEWLLQQLINQLLLVARQWPWLNMLYKILGKIHDQRTG